MALIDTIRRWAGSTTPARSVWPAITADDVAVALSQGGWQYRLTQTLSGDRQEIAGDFTGLVQGAYHANGVVFSSMLARMMLFSEARFQYQQMRGGRPGDLYGTPDLAILERPWPGGTTGDLLARIITNADIAGNAFIVRRPGDRLRLPRPDWVTMLFGSFDGPDAELGDLDADLIGLLYHPGGRYSGREPVTYLNANDPRVPNEFAHFAPIPDPLNPHVGMSWLTPIIREIMGDSAATSHKLKFFENGATPNMVVTVDIDEDKFDRWVETFEQHHQGATNAYKTLYLMAGTTAEVVGKDLGQMDFKNTQGAGETRIAAAAGMHPVIVGLSEGLQGSSLNAGNFTAAKRLVAEKTLRPLWRNLAGSLESIIPVPAGARLWYDERDIPFLQEDVKDAAEVLGFHATAIRTLTDGGYTPESVIDGVTSGDLKRLIHTHLLPVQLQAPGANQPEPAPAPPQRESGLADLVRYGMTQKPSEVNLNIHEGAFRSETPVTVNPAPITFAEGSIRSETTIEPAQVNFAEGSIRVDNPVTIEPANVTISEGAVRIDSPITVEPTNVTIEDGAIRSETPVTVNTPDVRVGAPEPPQVTVNVPEQEPPVVNVQAAPVERKRRTRKTFVRDPKTQAVTGSIEEEMDE